MKGGGVLSYPPKCNSGDLASYFLLYKNRFFFSRGMDLKNILFENRTTYRGFHEKGNHSLCPSGIDRKSPLNECSLQVPFI